MPIYEYQCAKCGVFDAMQKITEKPLRKCPTCKGKVSKLISNTAFQLKGTGWYVTDYAGKSGGRSSSSSEASSTTASAGSSSSDSSSAPSSSSDKAVKPAGSSAAGSNSAS